MGSPISRFLDDKDVDKDVNKDVGKDADKDADRDVDKDADRDVNSPQDRNPCRYKPNIVYYLGEELTASTLEKRTEVITEIIVCKTSLIDHWYIKVVLDMKHEEPLEIHYYNNSSIVARYPKTKDRKSIRETRYAPTRSIRLFHLLEVCLDFVEVRSYSILSYNCQKFVIDLTNRFTDRSTLSLLLLPVSHKISRVCAKTKVMALEKKFLLHCQRVGIRRAVQYLQQTNAEIKGEIDRRRASKGQVSGPEIDHFVNVVLTPETGQYRSSAFQNFLKKQDNKTIEAIRGTMMQSWRLASFVVFLEENKWGDREDILLPHKALNQYQTYQF